MLQGLHPGAHRVVSALYRQLHALDGQFGEGAVLEPGIVPSKLPSWRPGCRTSPVPSWASSDCACSAARPESAAQRTWRVPFDNVAALQSTISTGYAPIATLRATAALCPAAELHTPYGMTECLPVADIDLAIGAKEFVAITGASGSGKSTLLNILGCLDQPSAGRYRLEDADVSALDDDALSELRNRRIGFVFQSFHLLPRLSVLENVLLPLRYCLDPVPGAEDYARELLGRVGLADRMAHRPQQLSGGQQQRAAIARALLLKPALLLADEPTGNLDSKTAADVLGLFDELHRGGQTLVLVTHDPDVAERAPRHVRLKDGRLARVAYAYEDDPTAAVRLHLQAAGGLLAARFFPLQAQGVEGADEGSYGGFFNAQ
mgnify:CR=1 FL=1